MTLRFSVPFFEAIQGQICNFQKMLTEVIQSNNIQKKVRPYSPMKEVFL